MTQDRKYLYEGMYILNATLSNDAREKALERIKEGITQRGGEIHKIHDQGRRRMAYEIEGKREGHYVVLYFSLNSTGIKELWQEYHHHEDLIRFFTLRTETVKETLEFPAIIEQ